MTEAEAQAYGRKTRKRARELAQMGDIAIWASEPNAADWWLGEKSQKLGIVGSNGMIDVSGPVARAFVRGFRGGK